jgi:hypothetical protein
MKMPAHELAGIRKSDLVEKDFIHVLPTLFVERVLKLAVGTEGPSLAQPVYCLKVALPAKGIRVFSNRLAIALKKVDVGHVPELQAAHALRSQQWYCLVVSLPVADFVEGFMHR